MVSVMPPSGVGGLPGFNPGHHDISLASRYNHLAVMQDTQASYYQFTGVTSAQEQMAQTRSMPAPIARKIMEPTRGRSRGKTMPQSIGKTMPQSIGKTMPQSMAEPPTVTSANDLSAVNSKPKICNLPGCKGIHDHQNQNKGSKQIAMDQPSIGDGGPPRVRTTTSNQTLGPGSKPPVDLSSLSKSLFVDCSVEYELPMVPKIPPDSQPLLVIHPGWQQKRRITRSSSQQRLIYEEQQRMALQQHQHQYLQYMSSLSGNTVCSQCPPANAPGNHAAPQSQTQPTQASVTAVMQPPRPVPNPNIVATSTATAPMASSVTSRKRSYQATNLPQIMPPPQQQNQMCYSGFAATATATEADSRRPHQRPTAEFTESQESNTSKRARLSSASAQQVSASRAAAAQHQAQHAHAAAASHPSWGIPFPCHERSCMEMQHRQMALMHQHHQHQQQQQQAQQAQQQQHQQHQYMLRNHQQQQWQQQLLINRDDAGACPLPLPAPPPPVSGSNPAVVAGSNPPGGNRLAAPQTGAHSTGFFHHQMHHAHPGSHHQYHTPHNWHPAYFCPPSAVQLQRQQHQQHQQWLQQQQHYKQQQHQQQQQQQQQHIQSMQNNNCLQLKQPCCSKCLEGKCNIQETPSTVMFQQQQQQRRNVVANSNTVTHVHYRSV